MDTAALRDHVKAILDHGYDLSHDKLPEAPKTLRPPKQKSLNLVLLCGGYGGAVSSELSAVSPLVQAGHEYFSPTSSLKARTAAAAAAAAGSLCTALMPISSVPSLQYWLSMLEATPMLYPYEHCTYLVCNESDRERILTDLAAWSELNLPFRVSHVISNGCSAPSEWQGHAADLALALQATGDALPVAALVPGSFVILPHEYSLQRVLMHSVVRGRDVLGYCRLSMSDAKLLQGATLPVVTIADDSIPVPPLVDVATPGEASPGADTPVAEQLLVLTPGSVPRVGSVSASADLPGIAAELLRGGAPLFGVDVGPGRFSLATLAAIEYADAYFFSKTGVGKGEYRGDTWLQPLGSPSGPDDGTAKTLRSLTTFSVVPASEGGDLRGFGHTFFRRREGEAKGMGSTFYHLPPTFYASQYAATHGEVATLQLTMPQVHPSLRP